MINAEAATILAIIALEYRHNDTAVNALNMGVIALRANSQQMKKPIRDKGSVAANEMIGEVVQATQFAANTVENVPIDLQSHFDTVLDSARSSNKKTVFVQNSKDEIIDFVKISQDKKAQSWTNHGQGCP